MRAYVGEEKAFFLRPTAPFVVARRTHVPPVVARVVIVYVGCPGQGDVLVFGIFDALAFELACGVVSRELPCHPVGQFGLWVIAGDRACPE